MATADPSSPQSLNRYGYVTADPVNNRDSSGLLGAPVGYCELYPDDPICNPCPNSNVLGEVGPPLDSPGCDPGEPRRALLLYPVAR